MVDLRKNAGLVLVLALCVSGCHKTTAKKTEEIPLTTTEQRKVELLGQLDKKYDNPEAHYELGKLYQADGLWTKAEFEFNRAVGFDPAMWRAEAAIVKVLLQSGREDRAKFAAEHCMNRASFSAKASLLLGKGFQNEELDEYALACYQQALRLAPDSAALHKQIGYYYLSKGDQVRAEEYLKRSFQLDPYQTEVAGELGRMGIAIEMPRKKKQNSKSLDKLLDSEKEQQ